MLPFATEAIGKYFQSKTHFTIKNTYTPMMDYWDKKNIRRYSFIPKHQECLTYAEPSQPHQEKTRIKAKQTRLMTSQKKYQSIHTWIHGLY